MPPDTYSRDAVQQALRDVDMTNLVGRLDEVAHWNLMLSGGEQQRLGIARAMLYNPDYLFFDEATASMDEPSEEMLYKMLLGKMTKTTIISIGTVPLSSSSTSASSPPNRSRGFLHVYRRIQGISLH
jgi:putative ATP-binding cassette transporter